MKAMFSRKTLKKMPRVKRVVEEIIRVIKKEPKITPGRFDLAESPGLLGKDDPVILDIGCNDGDHTIWFLRLFKEPRVYSFEPDPRARERFKNNVKDERAKLFDFAISDFDGTIEFHVSSGTPPPEWEVDLSIGWDQSGSIRKPKKHLDVHPWCTFNESIIVKTKKLDTWCDEQGIGLIDFIWADVQGAEVDLIKGGKAALKRTRYFHIEYSNQELYEGQVSLREMLKLLPDFEVVYRYSYDVLLENKRMR